MIAVFQIFAAFFLGIIATLAFVVLDDVISTQTNETMAPANQTVRGRCAQDQCTEDQDTSNESLSENLSESIKED